MRDQSPGIDVVAELQPVPHDAGDRRCDGVRPQHGDQFRPRRGVAERRQRQRGVAADHRLRIVDQSQQRLVKRRVAAVLAHDPGRRLAKLQARTGRLLR